MFRTAYSPQIRMHVAAGRETQDIYAYALDEKSGQRYLEKTGEKNLYLEIQSYKDEVSIENIIARAKIGDMSGFRNDPGNYIDVTEIPKNLIEAKKAMTNIENVWKTLPLEIKNKYNNSIETFVAKAGSKEWAKDVGLIQPEKPIDPSLKAPETKIPVPETPTE